MFKKLKDISDRFFSLTLRNRKNIWRIKQRVKLERFRYQKDPAMGLGILRCNLLITSYSERVTLFPISVYIQSLCTSVSRLFPIVITNSPPFYFDHHPLLIQQLQLQSTLPVIRIRLFWNPSDEDSRWKADGEVRLAFRISRANLANAVPILPR